MRQLALLCLVTASCVKRPPPERLELWMARSESAWNLMKDDGQPVPSIDRAFVQAGMGTSRSIAFVVVPGVSGAVPKLQKLESIDDGRVTAVTYTASTQRIGENQRLELSGLQPGTRYRATFDDEETVESRTAPEKAEPTSVLLVSCNEPWSHARPDKVTAGVAVSPVTTLRNLDLRARGLMPVELVRTGESVKFDRPSFLLALGDQAYVDAEPDEEGSLALFGGPRSDSLRVEANTKWPETLRRIYRMHFLIPSFHRALSSLPSAMVWDDHEIRDGWGSQRDEEGLRVNSGDPWLEYFQAARQATWAFEVARNPNAGGEAVTAFDPSLDRELDTSFQWSDRLKVFLLDTRTLRGRPEGRVMSDAQMQRVNTWLQPCGAQPSVFMLGIPVPMSVDHENVVSATGKTLVNELDDDINDGWWATVPAIALRGRIETAVIEHSSRCPDDRVVLVSGDVHESGLVALSRGGKIFAYEVISSGIASMVFEGPLSRAFLSTRTEYLAKSETGVIYSGIGRVSTGSSFAELFFEFPDKAPLKARVLFFSSSSEGTTLTNLGTTLGGLTWKAETTGVVQLTAGAKITGPAIELDYGVAAPKSSDYSLNPAVTRCSAGTSISDLAADWSTVFATPRPCP